MSTRRIGHGFRALVLEGPHVGDWVEVNPECRHHVRLLEEMPLVDLLHRDPDIHTYAWRRYGVRVMDGPDDEVFAVGGYVPESFPLTAVPRLATVGIHALALLSS